VLVSEDVAREEIAVNPGLSRGLTTSVLAGSFCGLLFGYDIGAIASAAPELRNSFGLSASTLGLAVSSALFGTIAGSIAAGRIADAIDRRHTLLLAGALYLFAAVGAGFSESFTSFTIFRFVCGIAIGLISVVTPMYLAEVAPSKLRGRLVASFQLSLSIGVVLAFAAGYVVSLYARSGTAWRWSLAGGSASALLCEVFLLQAAPSPRWLALKQRFPEARRTLVDLGSADPDRDETHLVASLEDFGTLRQTRLFSRRYARSLLLAASIAIFNQLTGVNVLLYYILDVFKELGAGRLNGRKDAIVVACLSLVVTVVAVNLIDRVGRKPLLLSGAVGMGACLLLLPVIRSMQWPAETVIVVVACYNAFFGFSQGAVIWVYLSEIFPLPVRARGQSWGSTVHWVANALIVALFPSVASFLGRRVFFGFAILMVIQFLVILFVYPETKRMGLEALASDISL